MISAPSDKPFTTTFVAAIKTYFNKPLMHTWKYKDSDTLYLLSICLEHCEYIQVTL